MPLTIQPDCFIEDRFLIRVFWDSDNVLHFKGLVLEKPEIYEKLSKYRKGEIIELDVDFRDVHTRGYFRILDLSLPHPEEYEAPVKYRFYGQLKREE